mmetsp:Transcript_1912/g.3077  ORF Transcript_1912/g.3077 Transcript_1912/m.3077 type:complete len:404 (+) Transcript_1912:981-2192(+)
MASCSRGCDRGRLRAGTKYFFRRPTLEATFPSTTMWAKLLTATNCAILITSTSMATIYGPTRTGISFTWSRSSGTFVTTGGCRLSSRRTTGCACTMARWNGPRPRPQCTALRTKVRKESVANSISSPVRRRAAQSVLSETLSQPRSHGAFFFRAVDLLRVPVGHMTTAAASPISVRQSIGLSTLPRISQSSSRSSSWLQEADCRVTLRAAPPHTLYRHHHARHPLSHHLRRCRHRLRNHHRHHRHCRHRHPHPHLRRLLQLFHASPGAPLSRMENSALTKLTRTGVSARLRVVPDFVYGPVTAAALPLSRVMCRRCHLHLIRRVPCHRHLRPHCSPPPSKILSPCQPLRDQHHLQPLNQSLTSAIFRCLWWQPGLPSSLQHFRSSSHGNFLENRARQCCRRRS